MMPPERPYRPFFSSYYRRPDYCGWVLAFTITVWPHYFLRLYIWRRSTAYMAGRTMKRWVLECGILENVWSDANNGTFASDRE